MYAVVKAAGKEYKVSQGDLIRVEKMKGKVGEPVEMKEVLMVSHEGQVKIGTPFVKGATIRGQIVQEAKGRKLVTYKMKRRKNYRRTKGHRQTYTYIRVNEISLG